MLPVLLTDSRAIKDREEMLLLALSMAREDLRKAKDSGSKDVAEKQAIVMTTLNVKMISG